MRRWGLDGSGSGRALAASGSAGLKRACLFAFAASVVACAGNSGGPGTPGNVGGAGGDSNATSSAPWWTLPAGSRYFVRDGRAAPLLLRNATAGTVAGFQSLLASAHAAGAQVVRIQLTQGFGYDTLGITPQGEVRPDFAASWDAVLSAAQQQNLAVVPVFAIWGDWNTGIPDHNWTHFSANPLNQALGGPAATPAELFQDGETQRLWLGWLSTLIARWHKYPNIIAWEIFSELDLATGADQPSATSFAERASDVIRGQDPQGRPVFASTSDLPLIGNQPWTALWASRGADLVSLHPYDPALDQTTLARVQSASSLTQKPIFIGESGLDAAAPDGTTLTSAPAARVGLQQAVWAELVSGAATARAFYWEDGYAAYYPATGLPLVQSLNDVDTPAAAWLAQADYTDLVPATLSTSPLTLGAVLASADRARGWLRSPQLTAPSWITPALPDTAVQVSLPASAGDGAWTVKLTKSTGEALPDVAGASSAGVLSFAIPAGFDSVVFVAQR